MSTTQGKQFLFIVGAPRSGTTWLHRMISQHPLVAAIPEELTVFPYLNRLEVRYQEEKMHMDRGDWSQGAPLLYSEQEFYAGLRSIALDAYTRLQATTPKATHIIDKHPAYALHLALMDRLIPGCRVLHIIRDGREVVVSMMSAKRRLGFGAGEIRGATRDWASHIRAARRDGEPWGPERYMEVRYEELMERTPELLAEIFRFAGLSIAPAEIEHIAEEYAIDNKQVSRGDTSLNELRKKPGAIWKAKLGLEERWIMDRMAGDLLQELGYAEPGWWALKWNDKIQLYLGNIRRRILNVAGSTWHSARMPLAQRLLP